MTQSMANAYVNELLTIEYVLSDTHQMSNLYAGVIVSDEVVVTIEIQKIQHLPVQIVHDHQHMIVQHYKQMYEIVVMMGMQIPQMTKSILNVYVNEISREKYVLNDIYQTNSLSAGVIVGDDFAVLSEIDRSQYTRVKIVSDDQRMNVRHYRRI